LGGEGAVIGRRRRLIVGNVVSIGEHRDWHIRVRAHPLTIGTTEAELGDRHATQRSLPEGRPRLRWKILIGEDRSRGKVARIERTVARREYLKRQGAGRTPREGGDEGTVGREGRGRIDKMLLVRRREEQAKKKKKNAEG